MIELIFTKGPLTGVRFAIEADTVSIGRLNECDIELNQPNVSRQHAFIKRVGESLQLIDNNSGNGTFVNGKRVRNAALRNGDEIRIGSNTLVVDVQPEKMTGQEIKVARVKASQKPTRADKLSRFIVSDCTNGAPRTAEFSSENLTIGRGDKCRLILDDPEISRLHATIYHRQGGFTLKDSGSANGTLLNGERVIERQLASGDQLEMGQAIIDVEITGGLLRLTVTSRAASPATGPAARPSRPLRAPEAAERTAIRTAAPEVRPHSIVRVLLTVLAVALLLLFVGRNYAATSNLPGQAKFAQAHHPAADQQSVPAQGTPY